MYSRLVVSNLLSIMFILIFLVPQKCSEGAGAFRRQGNGAAQRAEALAYPLTGNPLVAGREMPPRLRGGVVTGL
jgi:hypothetical protein